MLMQTVITVSLALAASIFGTFAVTSKNSGKAKSIVTEPTKVKLATPAEFRTAKPIDISLVPRAKTTWLPIFDVKDNASPTAPTSPSGPQAHTYKMKETTMAEAAATSELEVDSSPQLEKVGHPIANAAAIAQLNNAPHLSGFAHQGNGQMWGFAGNVRFNTSGFLPDALNTVQHMAAELERVKADLNALKNAQAENGAVEDAVAGEKTAAQVARAAGVDEAKVTLIQSFLKGSVFKSDMYGVLGARPKDPDNARSLQLEDIAKVVRASGLKLTGIDCNSCSKISGDLSALSSLKDLKVLDLASSNVKGPLSALKGLSKLNRLNLADTHGRIVGTTRDLPTEINSVSLFGSGVTGSCGDMFNVPGYCSI